MHGLVDLPYNDVFSSLSIWNQCRTRKTISKLLGKAPAEACCSNCPPMAFHLYQHCLEDVLPPKWRMFQLWPSWPHDEGLSNPSDVSGKEDGGSWQSFCGNCK